MPPLRSTRMRSGSSPLTMMLPMLPTRCTMSTFRRARSTVRPASLQQLISQVCLHRRRCWTAIRQVSCPRCRSFVIPSWSVHIVRCPRLAPHFITSVAIARLHLTASQPRYHTKSVCASTNARWRFVRTHSLPWRPRNNVPLVAMWCLRIPNTTISCWLFSRVIRLLFNSGWSCRVSLLCVSVFSVCVCVVLVRFSCSWCLSVRHLSQVVR
mmetsp:Transcript_35629/g.89559  ORF Transcript_35629/g.89559 Transcript_35629/m.89559 type:complete len:211 (+) Transcript_35629:435-1067(+)